MENIYNMFDILVFPSIYEGLPLTLIEAQINGMHCVVSDAISQESKITNLVKFVSLNKTAVEWAQILNDTKMNRENHSSEIKNSDFNIENTIKQLEKIYKGR